MARLIRQIISVAVLLPVLLFAVGGTSFASWRCSVDGIARPRCCCPKPDTSAAEAAAGPARPTVSAPDCCDFERSHVEKAPSDFARSSSVSLLAALVALPITVWAPAAPAPPVPSVHQSPRQQPLAGWVLLLRKQAFLI